MIYDILSLGDSMHIKQEDYTMEYIYEKLIRYSLYEEYITTYQNLNVFEREFLFGFFYDIIS